MYIDNISLVNFRNYDNLNLKLKQGINIIYGNNAQGKTNLLESIYVLALTKSHRSFIDNNLIKNNKDISKIEGNIFINKMKNNFKIIISCDFLFYYHPNSLQFLQPFVSYLC